MSSQKLETRERVLYEAALAFRAHGPQGVSVQEIMRRAGLTHGGFYAHFSSKDDLLHHAIEHMFDQALERWNAATAGVPPAHGLLNFLNCYLTPLHVTHIESGCPIAALASDQARFPLAAREAFAAGTHRLQQAVCAHLDAMGCAEPATLATSVLNELAGAVVVARCATDLRKTQQILDASRTQLVARLGIAARI